jgi:thiamine-monophosphate kinase
MCPANEKPGSEAELVALFKNLFEPDIPPTDLLIGIGDDAAAFEPGVDPETKFVLTADMLVEDVHFRRKTHTYFDIGWRTSVANVSDIAAMGARPRWGIVTLAAPDGMTIDDIMEIARGLKEPMSEHDAYIIGGDLTRSPDRISISMTIVGETTTRLLTRSGAKLGDVIAVTGSLGGSAAGIFLMTHADADVPDDLRKRLIDRHLQPHARVHAGEILSNIDGIHSMMDISDGLGIDLGRICAASGTGARIMEESVPVNDDVKSLCKLLELDPLRFINGGEDFELLLTGEYSAVEHARKILENEADQPSLTIIGEIIDHPFGINLARIDGSVINPANLGWDHFRMHEDTNG